MSFSLFLSFFVPLSFFLSDSLSLFLLLLSLSFIYFYSSQCLKNFISRMNNEGVPRRRQSFFGIEKIFVFLRPKLFFSCSHFEKKEKISPSRSPSSFRPVNFHHFKPVELHQLQLYRQLEDYWHSYFEVCFKHNALKLTYFVFYRCFSGSISTSCWDVIYNCKRFSTAPANTDSNHPSSALILII